MESNNIVQVIAGVLAVACVVIIIMRRKAKGGKPKAEDDF